MTYFTRTSHGTPAAELRHLTNMYKMIGVEAPTRYAEIRAIILDTPEPHQVIADYAARAYTADDPKALVTEAREAITAAIAGDELKKRFLAIEPTQLANQLNGMKQDFRTAAAKAFDKDIKRLTEAANQLDHNNPLDAELAIAQDNGKALSTVRELLPKLGQYASMWVASDTNASTQLRFILPILDLPVLVRERVHHTLSANTTTLNPVEAAGTLTVRRLDRDAHTNVDRALLGIARGEYPGVSFNITTPTPSVGEAFMQDREVDKRSWV